MSLGDQRSRFARSSRCERGDARGDHFPFMLNIVECEGRAVSDQVKLPFRIVEPLLTRFKMDQLVSYKASTATNDYVYVLTEAVAA